MNQSSNNASGAGVLAVLDDLDRNARINYDLACAREERNTATREDVEAKAIALRLWDTLGQVRATIESAMAALQLAARRFSDQNGEVSAKVWNDNYDAVKAINDALTAFGPAPPATASNLPPINSDRLNALREQYAERVARAPATDAPDADAAEAYRIAHEAGEAHGRLMAKLEADRVTPPAASQSAEERIKALETVIRPHIEDLEATAKVAEDYNLLPLAEEFRKAAAEFKAALETK